MGIVGWLFVEVEFIGVDGLGVAGVAVEGLALLFLRLLRCLHRLLAVPVEELLGFVRGDLAFGLGLADHAGNLQQSAVELLAALLRIAPRGDGGAGNFALVVGALKGDDVLDGLRHDVGNASVLRHHQQPDADDASDHEQR